MQKGNIIKSESKTNLLSTIPDQELQNNPNSSNIIKYLQLEIEVKNIKKSIEKQRILGAYVDIVANGVDFLVRFLTQPI